MGYLGEVGDPHPGSPGWRSEEMNTRAQKRTHSIQSNVDKVFASLASGCPNLSVIVFATHGPCREDSGVHSFRRSKRIHHRDETTFLGAPIEQDMIKHYEPCSDILGPEDVGFCRRL